MSNRDYLNVRNEEIKKFRRDGLTLAAIGKKYGVTREAIRLICKGIPNPDLKTYHKKKCKSCNKEFVVPSTRKNAKTCSNECFAKIQTYNNYKDGKWTKELVDMTCAGCGKKFQRTKKLIQIAKHSYESRGMDYANKKWYCDRLCNLSSIREERFPHLGEH
tara:strand:+ start:636 stop:1118 length:483 start_codon:yes stop_codon:yes gene_type:complete